MDERAQRVDGERASTRDVTLTIAGRTTACGRWFTVRNIRPRYSPIRPSITSCVPGENQQRRHQPAPAVGRPAIVNHSQTTTPSASTPAAAMTSPSTVATRSGSTEKFTHALSHSRTSRRSV